MRVCFVQVRDLRACIVPLDTSRTVSRSSATDDVPEDDVLEEGVCWSIIDRITIPRVVDLLQLNPLHRVKGCRNLDIRTLARIIALSTMHNA